MIVWCIVYILYLLCNIAILLFDSFATLILLPLLLILWLAGIVGAIILLVKTFCKRERKWYLAFIPLCCVCLVTILSFLPLPWHIWNAQITYRCNRPHYREVIKNPPEENLISQTRERTVIGFLHGEYILTRSERRIVYISDDALPQKEMFPFAKSVKIYRKLSPKWYYVQIKY